MKSVNENFYQEYTINITKFVLNVLALIKLWR